MDGGRILRALLQFIVSRRTAIIITGRLGQILAILFAGYGLFTFQFSLVLIFTIMFFACSIEMFQFNMKERMQQMADQMASGPMGYPFNSGPVEVDIYHTGPFSHNSSDAAGARSRPVNGEIVDAEDIRRIQ